MLYQNFLTPDLGVVRTGAEIKKALNLNFSNLGTFASKIVSSSNKQFFADFAYLSCFNS